MGLEVGAYVGVVEDTGDVVPGEEGGGSDAREFEESRGVVDVGG